MQQQSTIPQPGQNFAPENLPSPQPTLPAEPPTSRQKSEGWKSVLSTIFILLAAPLVALFLTTYIFQSYEVDGPSMETTLHNHDRLIVLKAPRTAASLTGKEYIPQRGEIIIFKKHDAGLMNDNGDEKQLIKRIIGLPGDRVVVKDGTITVYNTSHPRGYNPDEGQEWARSITTTPGSVDVTIGSNEVFAVGDNRTNSLDSRYFGPVESHEIVGKLILRVFPIGDAGWF